MIFRKSWYKDKKKFSYEYTGYFLLGILPLYIARVRY